MTRQNYHSVIMREAAACSRMKQRPIRFVAVRSDGVVTVHAPEVAGNYGTLCGISVDDDEEVGRVVALPASPKIDCKVCVATIRAAKKYRATDLRD